MKEFKKVGCTEVTDDLTLIFYISSMDENGREAVPWGFTRLESIARKNFEDAKPDNYDMHLYVALFKNYESDEEELVDSEVIDSYVDDEDSRLA
jgi:hypothetical protein